MKNPTLAEVTGPDGLHGTIDGAPPDGTAAVIRLDDGRELLAPPGLLERRGERSYYLPLSRAQLPTTAAPDRPHDQVVVPVVREEARIGTRTVETGRVRVRKLVREEEESFDEPLAREEVTVERVPVERFVSAPQPMRREGDTVVIPIVEEVLVVEKRLMLKEEVRVHKRVVEERVPQVVTLRREEAVVERVSPLEGGEKTRPDAADGTGVANPHPAD
jgi:uncharacterized protein (TIGR02271 family)